MGRLPLILGFVQFDQSLAFNSQQFIVLLDQYESAELFRRNYPLNISSCQFIFTRLLLKVLVSKRLSIQPERLSIRSACSGQPLLFIDGCYSRDISLSISHDHYHLLVGVGLGCRCGVDVQGIFGVDWPLVMSFMGWTAHVEAWLANYEGKIPVNQLTQEVASALLWCAYEAWKKLTLCTSDLRAFSWKCISLISIDPATATSTFRMELSKNCPFSNASLVLSLRSYEVLAIAYIPF